jgi:tetratricopeptide (TPR) repeat protein
LKISVQTGDTLGEARTLTQLGNLYSGLGRREDAVRCNRQSADLFVQLQDLRHEGLARNNLALVLVDLKRYAEVRAELERAIECGKPFGGYAAQPWKAFGILSHLERAVGNEPAAQNARAQAVEACLAYRRDGGAPQNQIGEMIASDSAGLLTALQQAPDLRPNLRALIPPLQAILAGSRDTTLAADPNIGYDDAAELLLLIERLQSASGASAS